MSYTFGTPITSASMEFAFGTPAGDAKTVKTEPSLFASNLPPTQNAGFSFTSPSATVTTLGTATAPLFSTTFGSPTQSAFGAGSSLFSPTVSAPFAAGTLTTPLNTATIQAVLPTYASTAVKSPTGLLGTAFQSPIATFVSTGPAVPATFAAPVQSTLGQSVLSPVAFGTTAPAAVNRFGTPNQATVTPSFGATPQSTTSSFGLTQGTTMPQFSFGTSSITKPKTTTTTNFAPTLSFAPSTTSPAQQPPLSFNFGNISAAATSAPTFPLPTNTPTPTTNTTTPTSAINTAAPSLDFSSFSSTTATTSAALTIPAAVSRTVASVASVTKPLVASFGTGTNVSTSAVPTFSLGVPTNVTTSPSNVLGSSSLVVTTTAAPTAVTTFSSVVPSVTTSISSGFALPVGTTTKTNTTAALSSVVPSSVMTYGQLEDFINKWTVDLENQCKIFSNQAKQLNAWDRLLISNGDKILALNTSVERVKEQQHQLDQELDFIRAQQRELEHLLLPLEKELQDTPVTDTDRNHTYQLAENMDSQLKQMSEDLKEIIETLNESNRNQELSNPITQIGRILNAHMNSLQWIDVNTNKISSQLDQIAKMHDVNRRNHEIVLQRTYD